MVNGKSHVTPISPIMKLSNNKKSRLAEAALFLFTPSANFFLSVHFFARQSTDNKESE
jgi:hypothetical protein